MLKFLLIFLLTALIVQFVFRDKGSAKKQRRSNQANQGRSQDPRNNQGSPQQGSPQERAPEQGAAKRPIQEIQETRETVPSAKNKMRGEIIEPNEFISTYGLMYYDVQEKDSDHDYLASQGYQGGGPSWLGIVYGVLKIKDPELLQRVEFDDEGDGLLINGESRPDMEKISFWINEVKADRKLMQRAIMMANIDGKME